MSGLPDINLEDTKMEVGIPELREELELSLSDKDKSIVFYFFLQNDCANVVKLLKNPNAEISYDGNSSACREYFSLSCSRAVFPGQKRTT